MRINAFIACRLGSKRIKFKNLLLIKGKPLFSYLTDNAILCKKITNLFINTDSKLIIEAAKQLYGNRLKYFLREPHLGTSNIALDDYVYDFIDTYGNEVDVMIEAKHKELAVDKYKSLHLTDHYSNLPATRSYV